LGRSQRKPEPAEIIAVIRRVLAENGRSYVSHYTLAALCMLAIAATTGFIAYMMKPIINDIFYGQQWGSIYTICAQVIIIFTVRGFATYGQAVLLAKVGNNIVARYQTRIFDHLMRLDIGYFTATRSGQLAARVAQNVTGIRDLLNMTLAAMARDVVTLVGLVAVMVSMDPLLSLIAFVIGPPLIFSVNYLMRRLRSVTREAVDINSRLLGAMQESVQGISIIKAFTMEEQLAGKLAGLIRNAEARSNKIARVSERLGPITETLAGGDKRRAARRCLRLHHRAAAGL
jgi:ATP-binding cassette, subfamily B, bacterial MsbA